MVQRENKFFSTQVVGLCSNSSQPDRLVRVSQGGDRKHQELGQIFHVGLQLEDTDCAPLPHLIAVPATQ